MKVNVKAKQDFFDRANNIQRVKDQEFLLKDQVATEYAANDWVEESEPTEKPTKKKKREKAAQAAAKKKEIKAPGDMSTTRSVKSK